MTMEGVRKIPYKPQKLHLVSTIESKNELYTQKRRFSADFSHEFSLVTSLCLFKPVQAVEAQTPELRHRRSV